MVQKMVFLGPNSSWQVQKWSQYGPFLNVQNVPMSILKIYEKTQNAGKFKYVIGKQNISLRSYQYKMRFLKWFLTTVSDE